MNKINFGILSTAQIGINSVIPAIQNSEYCEVKGIASRTEQRAKEVASKLNIDKAYSLYDDLLEDDAIDAVYIPLPNHLHVPWSIKALEAGKHVLCEKPLGLNAQEVNELQKVTDSYQDLKCMEAFMYHYHPQWEEVKQIINNGDIGKVKSMYSTFSYYNTNPDDIRNKYIEGGGGLMDIGCYCISLSRFIFNQEPDRVVANLTFDPDFNIDIQGNCILDFEDKSASFIYGTQQFRGQEAIIYGTEGKIKIEMPFTPSADEDLYLSLETENSLNKVKISPIDQYRLQADEFAKSIIDGTPQPFPLQDAYNNMKVIDALFESDKKDKWKAI
ncbi:MAG: Gfo/Idh/MocA family oxidoreductase [Candidatus Marinimicrobia bacterium]|nr:Gfo/Idh/MocA family oxidoreductase [Candidatus Neomarinimicrobiota bacterium]